MKNQMNHAWFYALDLRHIILLDLRKWHFLTFGIEIGGLLPPQSRKCLHCETRYAVSLLIEL